MKPIILLAAMLMSCEDIEHFTDPPKEEPCEIVVPPIPSDSTPRELPPPPPHPGCTP